MVQREVAALGIENVEVVGFNALLMKFAEKQGASMIIRGLRAVASRRGGGVTSASAGAGAGSCRAGRVAAPFSEIMVILLVSYARLPGWNEAARQRRPSM